MVGVLGSCLATNRFGCRLQDHTAASRLAEAGQRHPRRLKAVSPITRCPVNSYTCSTVMVCFRRVLHGFSDVSFLRYFHFT